MIIPAGAQSSQDL